MLRYWWLRCRGESLLHSGFNANISAGSFLTVQCVSNAMTFDQPTMLLFPSHPDRRNSSQNHQFDVNTLHFHCVVHELYSTNKKVRSSLYEQNQCFILVFPSDIIIHPSYKSVYQSGQSFLPYAFLKSLDLNSGNRKHKLALQAR